MGLLESLSPREGKGKERKAQGQGGKEGGESNINATVALEYAESAFGVPKVSLFLPLFVKSESFKREEKHDIEPNISYVILTL